MRLTYYKNAFIIALGVLLSFTSCVEEINLSDLNGPPSNKLVVEGSITSEAKAHIVKLTRMNEAVVRHASQPVSGAKISIRDGENVFWLEEKNIGSGIYVTDSTVKGEVGNTYTLTIESEGKIYTASDKMESVRPFSERDKLFIYDKYLFGSSERGFTLQVPLISFGFPEPVLGEIGFLHPDQGKERNLMEKIVFYQFPGVEANGLIPRLSEPFVFFKTDTLKQSRLSMSEAHYKFIKALLIQSEYFGGALGTVPADLPTNLSEGAVGFFSASDAVFAKIALKK